MRRCCCKALRTHLERLPAAAWHRSARRSELPGGHPMLASGQPYDYIRQQSQLHQAIASKPPIVQQHTIKARVLAFSPDLRLAASMDSDSLSVWDVATGLHVHRICVSGHSNLEESGPLFYRPSRSGRSEADLIAWSPDMQTIAFLQLSACKSSAGLPRLHLAAWSAEQRQLRLQHTVQVPAEHEHSNRGHSAYAVQWTPNSAHPAVHAAAKPGKHPCAWLISSQGQVIQSWETPAIPDLHAGPTVVPVPYACNSDSSMFAAQLTTTSVGILQVEGHYSVDTIRFKNMAWAAAADSSSGSSSYLLLWRYRQLELVDVAARPVPTRVAYTFQPNDEIIAVSLSHIALQMGLHSLVLMRVRLGGSLVTTADIPISPACTPRAVQFSPSGSLLAVTLSDCSHGIMFKLAIYAVANGVLLASHQLQNCRYNDKPGSRQLRWSTCGQRLLCFDARDVSTEMAVVCTIVQLT